MKKCIFYVWSLDRFEFMHEILVLMASSTTEISGEYAHMRRLARDCLLLAYAQRLRKFRPLGLLDTSACAFIEGLCIKFLVLALIVQTY